MNTDNITVLILNFCTGSKLFCAADAERVAELVRAAEENGRQEIRDAVAALRMKYCCAPTWTEHVDCMIRLIAPKSRRYVVAPAGAELGADEVRINWKNPESVIMSFVQGENGRFKKLTGPVYLKPGWTRDKGCRDIVAKLLRDGVEIREEN